MKSNLQSSSRFNTDNEIVVDSSSDSENSQGHKHEDILEDKLEEDYEDIEKENLQPNKYMFRRTMFEYIFINSKWLLLLKNLLK